MSAKLDVVAINTVYRSMVKDTEKKIQKALLEFETFERAEKRNLCLEILSDAREHGGIFLELYNLVESGNATDKDYDDIYASTLDVIYAEEETKIRSSLENLEMMRNRLIVMKEREHAEKLAELSEADKVLASMI